MPVPPAELTAHFTIEGPDEARAAAASSGGAARARRRAGRARCSPAPATRCSRRSATRVAAALDAGAHGLDVKLEAPTESRPLKGRERARLIAVARGDAEPDLVIEGARVFCAFTREWLEGDVAVADGMVAGIGAYEGGERIDARGRYLVPGFIDAHMHVESSKLTPAEFARAVLPHGTTAIVCDPHEVANVLGSDGVHWMLDASEGLPLTVFVMAPSCVPASAFESPRRELTVGDMEAILRRRRALGVAEMMNFPGVIAGDPDVLAKLEVRGASHADGHAPGVLGRDLDAYAAAGIRSDHEATTYEEALEKRRRGMWVLIREASNARNLRALLPLVREHGPERCAFCTDDREPDILLREGHINQMCRVAVEEGIAPEDALVMATLHAALAHGLDGFGAIAPGYRADLVLLDDLDVVRARAWCSRAAGSPRATGAPSRSTRRPSRPTCCRPCAARPVTEADLALDANGAARVRVIEIVPEQLITLAREEEPGRGPRPTRRATWPRSPSSSATTPPAASASGS